MGKIINGKSEEQIYKENVDAHLAETAKQVDLNSTNSRVVALENNKADKSEVTNVMTPKGNLSYASLPTTGNEIGWYYYCPDGDGTNGSGNYVWNGTVWYFGGTGDEGYSNLKRDLDDYKQSITKNNKNLYNRSHIRLNKTLVSTGITDSTSNFITNYMDIEGLSSIVSVIFVDGVASRRTFAKYAFFDKNRTLLEYRNIVTASITDFPEGAKYIVGAYNKAYSDSDIVVCEGTDVTDCPEYIPYGYKLNPDIYGDIVNPNIVNPNIVNPNIVKPNIISDGNVVTYGANIAGSLADWIVSGDTTNDGSTITLLGTGAISKDISVISNTDYLMTITGTYKNDVGRMLIAFGAESERVFYGTDAGKEYVFNSIIDGTITISIGGECDAFEGTITGITIKPITNYFSENMKVGENCVTSTYASDFAIGGGHLKTITGKHNSAYGKNAQQDISVGSYNVAMGESAQQSLTFGRCNVGIGYLAQRDLKTGYYNVAIGMAAQAYLKDGSWNVGIGNEAQKELTSGDSNVSIGRQSCFKLATGSENTHIGKRSGYATKTGEMQNTVSANGQTCIGAYSGQGSNTDTDYITTVGFDTWAKGKGSGAFGVDSEGNGAKATEENQLVFGTPLHSIVLAGHKINFNSDGTVSWESIN